MKTAPNNKKEKRRLGMSTRVNVNIDAEAIVIPLSADTEIIADLRAGMMRRLLNKILDGFRCRHRWDLVVPHPDSWSRWDFVSYRTMMPDVGVFRRRVANTLCCEKCGSSLDVSDWDETVKFVEIGRRYFWISQVYFDILTAPTDKDVG